jgi:hypothetical protein
LVEQLTFNQWVAGSNPARLTTFTLNIKVLRLASRDAAFAFLTAGSNTEAPRPS